MLTFGLALRALSLEEALWKAIEAERLGLDCVWLFERPSLVYPPKAIPAVAAETRKVRVGIGLIPLLHSWKEIASTILSLNEVYGERFDLCLIPGDKRHLRRVGVSTDKLRETIGILAETGRKVKEVFAEKDVSCKVWVGAQGPRLLKASAFSDGVLLNTASPDIVKWALKVMGGLPEGRDFKIGIVASAYLYRGRVKEQPYRVLCLSAAVALLGASKSLKRKLGAPEWLLRGEPSVTEEILKKLPKGLLEKFSICMHVERFGSYISELSRLGVSHMVFSYPIDLSTETLQELASALKPLKRRSSIL